MNEVIESVAPPAGPPWIQPQIQQEIKWRDGDIVISVPVKSGTTEVNFTQIYLNDIGTLQV